MDLGTLGFSFLFNVFDSQFSFLDEPIPPIADKHHATIKRAKDVILDPTIIDVSKKNPRSAEYTQDSLRRQIIQGCQHLDSYLISVNQLMDRYEASIAANPPSSSDNA